MLKTPKIRTAALAAALVATAVPALPNSAQAAWWGWRGGWGGWGWGGVGRSSLGTSQLRLWIRLSLLWRLRLRISRLCLRLPFLWLWLQWLRLSIRVRRLRPSHLCLCRILLAAPTRSGSARLSNPPCRLSVLSDADELGCHSFARVVRGGARDLIAKITGGGARDSNYNNSATAPARWRANRLRVSPSRPSWRRLDFCHRS
jgi:hypothetical protein